MEGITFEWMELWAGTREVLVTTVGFSAIDHSVELPTTVLR
jgi:hypothetical protein